MHRMIDGRVLQFIHILRENSLDKMGRASSGNKQSIDKIIRQVKKNSSTLSLSSVKKRVPIPTNS
jgi:hypothetical protein